MTGIAQFTARLIRAGKRAYERKWSFCGIFALVFFASVTVLGQYGLLPDAPVAHATPDVILAAGPLAAASVPAADAPELPETIAIPALNMTATIANPATADIEALDALLLKGAVRYPTSAKLGEAGNVVLFGHSSYLPIVYNQAYKTFNGIQKLVAGDLITVSSAGTAYTYRVRSVAKENVNGAAGIELATSGRVLTLATCNSFATKSDRFVVTADFVESHSISI